MTSAKTDEEVVAELLNTDAVQTQGENDAAKAKEKQEHERNKNMKFLRKQILTLA